MEDGEKSNTTVFVGVRIVPDAREKLFRNAKEERRSVSKQIEHMIMNYIEKQ